MKITKFLLLALSLLFALPAHALADRAMPMDTAIVYGTLDNGFQYYILRCERPAYKANFYLLENIGSTVEEPSQRGYAHLIEHLAFLGTENFPGVSMVNALEQNGISYGYDINASTSSDATVFNICNVDTRRGEGLVDTCLLALRDISCALSFDPAMVEREKMVILEEWRQDDGPFTRLVDKMFPVLFGEGNRYNQMPIGSPVEVSAATPQSLRNFYETWYQPQHQAVIVIGFIDPEEIRQKIVELWGQVPKPANPSVRVWEQIPDHKGAIAGVVVDEEMPGCQMDFWFKVDIPPRDQRDRVSYLNSSFVGYIGANALSRRLADILYENNSPFSSARTEFTQYYIADSRDGFRAYALYDRNKRTQALLRLITELKRIATYGITPEELDMNLRSMQKTVDNLDVIYDEKNNYEQFDRISEHFLKGNVVLSLADDKKSYQNFIDTVRPADVNAFLRKVITPDNLSAMLVEKEVGDTTVPIADEYRSMITQMWDTVQVRPYQMDTTFLRPLIKHELKPGRILDFEYDTLFLAKHYQLENGARVAVCVRDVLTDEISLRAVKRGGESALLPIDFADGTFAPDMAELSGVGDFSVIDLSRKFADKGIDLSVNYTPYAEIIEGTSRVSELEELLQLLHLRLTTVRRDTVAFANWKAVRIGMLNDMADSPDKVFSDSIRSVLYAEQRPLMRQICIADLDSLDYDNALLMFQERNANPAGYDFIIVGNFDFEDVEPLIEKYIGSLPGDGNAPKQAFKPFGRLAVDGKRHVRFSKTSQSAGTQVYIALEIHCPYTIQDEMTLQVLSSILEKTCIQTLRSEAGATYSPHVSATSGEVDGFHSLFISFDTNENMAQSLVDQVFAMISRIAADGPNPELFQMVRDYTVKSEYTSTLQQAYPMTVLTHGALYGDDDAARRALCARAVTPAMVQEMAARLADAPVQVSLIMDMKP